MNNIKELLSVNRFALRVLHDCLNYDFCKPYAIMHHKGKFTTGKVLKMSENAGFTPSAKIAVLMRDTKSICDNDLHILTVDPGGNVKIDIKTSFSYGGRSTNFSRFYAKRCFEEMRKRDTVEAFFVVQERENLCKKKEKQRDLSQRFIYIPQPCEFACDGWWNRWYNNILLQETGRNGEQFRLTPISADRYIPNMPHTKNLYDIIDKSGYLLEERRYNLKHMAAQLRARRAAERFAQENTAPDVEKLGELVQAEKSSIISALQSAKTADDFSKLSYLLYWDFSSILRRFAEHKGKAGRKEYPSVYVYSAAAEGIKKSLSDLREKVQKEAGKNA